ncbi:MAG: four helix bundle protein [Robiginitalea sp.]|uniref:four helix bundle protein n=1 Tax=Robiginitalea sp. TaxID=1902411 RepID=UPI003C734BCA
MEIWKLARDISVEIFRIYQESELKRDYALWNQMNRSSGSIMDNLAEGFERNGNKEFRQFLSVAKASCGELRSQLYRCYDRNYIDKNQLEDLLEQVRYESRKISNLLVYLSKSDMRGSKFST